MSEVGAVTQFGSVPSFELAQPPTAGGVQAGQQIQQFGNTVQDVNQRLTSARREMQVQQLHAQGMRGLLDAQYSALQQQDPQKMQDTYMAAAGQVRQGLMDQSSGDDVVQREIGVRFDDMESQFQHQVNRHSLYLGRINEEARVTNMIDDTAPRLAGLDTVGRTAALGTLTDQIDTNPALNDAKRIGLRSRLNLLASEGFAGKLKGELAGLPDDQVGPRMDELQRWSKNPDQVTDVALYGAATAAENGDVHGVERLGGYLSNTAPKQYGSLMDRANRIQGQNNAAAVPQIIGGANQALNTMSPDVVPYASLTAKYDSTIRPFLSGLKDKMGDSYPGDDAAAAQLLKPKLVAAAQTGNQTAFDAIGPIVARSDKDFVDEHQQRLNSVVATEHRKANEDTANDVARGVLLGSTSPEAADSAFKSMMANKQLTPEQYKTFSGMVADHADKVVGQNNRDTEIRRKLADPSSPLMIDSKYDPQIMNFLAQPGRDGVAPVQATKGVFEQMNDPEAVAQATYKLGHNPLAKQTAESLSGDEPDLNMATYFARTETMSPALNARVYKQLNTQGMGLAQTIKDKTAGIPPMSVGDDGKLGPNPQFSAAVKDAIGSVKNLEVPQLQKQDVNQTLWSKTKPEEIGAAALSELNNRIPKEIAQGASPILGLGFLEQYPSGQASLAIAHEYAKAAADKYPVYLANYNNTDRAREAALTEAATQTLWTHGPIVWGGQVNYGAGGHTLPYDQATEIHGELEEDRKAGKLPDDFTKDRISSTYFPEWDKDFPGKAEGSNQVVRGAWRLRPINGETRLLMVNGAEYHYLPRKQALGPTEYGQWLQYDSQKRQAAEATRFDTATADDGMVDR